MKENVWKILLEEVQKRKMTVIISSHNLKELENVCTNIGIMKNGEMTLEKELEEQDNNIQKIQVVFSNNEEIEKIKEKLQMLKEEKIGSVYYFIVKGKQKEIEEKLKEYNLTLMEFLPLSLEEVFMFENGGEANV